MENENKNNQMNIFYYFIPISISNDLIGKQNDLKIESEYLKGNVLSILEKCKYINSSFNLYDYLKSEMINGYINKIIDGINKQNKNFDFNYEDIVFIESRLYSFEKLYINDKDNEYAKLKYLCIKVNYNLEDIDKITIYNRIIFKALSKIDSINYKLEEITTNSKYIYYKPRVLSIVIVDDNIDENYKYYSQISNKLSNASKDIIIKIKDERIHKNTLYSTSIRGGNLIKSSKDSSFINDSFENNYKSLFLLALNQIMICEYENENVTEEIKEYNYKKTDDKNINNMIINIKRQIATYFFDVTTNVTNINLFYRDLLVNFVLEPSQKELMENLEILNSLVNKNMEIKRNKHDFIGKIALFAQAWLLIILAILQVVQDENKKWWLLGGIAVGVLIGLPVYLIYIKSEK